MNFNLYVFTDIDATCTNVGDRFTSMPPPPSMGKPNRKNKEYKEYLDKVQTDEKLMKDKPVPGMQEFLRRYEKELIYLTSREEKYRAITIKWLKLHNFPQGKLIMRPHGNEKPAHEFKREEIENICTVMDNVIVIDDDLSGELQKVCKEKGWTFFKACSGGQVLL